MLEGVEGQSFGIEVCGVAACAIAGGGGAAFAADEAAQDARKHAHLPQHSRRPAPTPGPPRFGLNEALP